MRQIGDLALSSQIIDRVRSWRSEVN